ncbi:hypothetical protein CCH79_00013642 [Gambusia affinis]|uniref:Rho GDP-dissociation inhibitor 3 n=1 Tax=Gambusia affinis TaxID=33528 RepID=A0A315WBR2_GAMAF|nr:hypothetical protein CCH79_00013642 [Gambusia affinis]
MLGLDVCEFGGQVLELLWLTMCYKGLLADKSNLAIEEEDEDKNLNYNPPAQKSLQEIQAMDKDDESLVKYKQTLLGPEAMSPDPTEPNVRVTRLILLCDDAPEPITMDLTGAPPLLIFSSLDRVVLVTLCLCAGELSALRETSFTLQEGAKYRLKVHFKVNRDIVSGLKYRQVTYKKGVRKITTVCMMGSYGPRAEEQEFLCPADEAPKGIMSRGQYAVTSCFTDDDKNVYLSWEWILNISKDGN